MTSETTWREGILMFYTERDVVVASPPGDSRTEHGPESVDTRVARLAHRLVRHRQALGGIPSV
ncbi:MAG: hypothetical protein ACYCV1_10375 [Acidimicrobiales bacterium]